MAAEPAQHRAGHLAVDDLAAVQAAHEVGQVGGRPDRQRGRVRRTPFVANPVEQPRVGVAERSGPRGHGRQPDDADQDVGGEVVAHRPDEDAEVADRELTLVQEVPEARVLDALVVLPLNALGQVELAGGGLTGRLDEEEQLADAGRPEHPTLVQRREHRTLGHVDDPDRPLGRREIGQSHRPRVPLRRSVAPADPGTTGVQYAAAYPSGVTLDGAITEIAAFPGLGPDRDRGPG